MPEKIYTSSKTTKSIHPEISIDVYVITVTQNLIYYGTHYWSYFLFLTIPCGSNPINLNLIWRNNCFPSVKQSSYNCLKNSSFNKTSIISNYAWPHNTKILGRDSIQFIKTVNLENCYCENGRLYIQIKIGQTKLTHVRKCKKESKLSLTSCCDK